MHLFLNESTKDDRMARKKKQHNTHTIHWNLQAIWHTVLPRLRPLCMCVAARCFFFNILYFVSSNRSDTFVRKNILVFLFMPLYSTEHLFTAWNADNCLLLLILLQVAGFACTWEQEWMCRMCSFFLLSLLCRVRVYGEKQKHGIE